MNIEKIGLFEAIALVSIVMINKIILNTPKEIISSIGSSAWINVFYVSIIAIIFVWILAKLFKNFQGHDILYVSEYLGGNTLKNIIGILHFLLLLLVPIFVIKNFSETLKLIYFRSSPTLYILLFFIVCSMIANRFSLKVLSKVNLMLMPVILLSIIIILISSIEDFAPERIFPILGYGVNTTFFSGLSNLFSFSGIGYLLFLNPLIDKTKNFKKMSIISITISAFCLFFSVICILLSLSYTFQSGENFSLYLLTRNLSYGRFVQRVDAIFIFVWILSTISYICIAMNFLLYIFKRLTNITDTTYINFTLHLIILAILLLPINLGIFTKVLGTVVRDSVLSLTFGSSIIILILANIKKKIIEKESKKEVINYES